MQQQFLPGTTLNNRLQIFFEILLKYLSHKQTLMTGLYFILFYSKWDPPIELILHVGNIDSGTAGFSKVSRGMWDKWGSIRNIGGIALLNCVLSYRSGLEKHWENALMP